MILPSGKWALLLPLLVVAEIIFNILIIKKVPYTEIDWIAYMQEVGGFLSGELDYTKLQGDTGPCVYPAGFLYVYSVLYWITDAGSNIPLAQYLFAALYCVFIAVVFLIYKRTNQVWILWYVVLCASRRIHSIFVLRLFNDGIAMLLLYIAIYLLLKNRWSLACLLFSLAVSIKMNILLFAPGLLLLLLKTFGVAGTVSKLFICAAVQVLLAVPFLLVNTPGYLHRAFDLGRKFFQIWSVNLQFVPADIFGSGWFAIALLALHLLFLVLFLLWKWTAKSEGGVIKSITERKQTPLNPAYMVYVLFTSNFIGIVFARSLHPQFYVWYFHSLPFLLCSIAPSPSSWVAEGLRVAVVAGIELVWNIFPSNVYSSLALTLLHGGLLLALLMRSVPPTPYLNLPLKSPKTRVK